MRHQNHSSHRDRQSHPNDRQNRGHDLRHDSGARRNYTAHNPEGHNQYSHVDDRGQDQHPQHQGRPQNHRLMRDQSEQSVRAHMRQSHWDSSTHPRDESGRFSSQANPSYGYQQSGQASGAGYQDSYDRYDSPSRGGRGSQNTWRDDEGRFDSRSNSRNDLDNRNDRNQRNDYGHYETRGQYNLDHYEDDDMSDVGINDDFDDMDREELDNRRYYSGIDQDDRNQDHLQNSSSRRGHRGHYRR